MYELQYRMYYKCDLLESCPNKLTKTENRPNEFHRICGSKNVAMKLC